MISYKQIRAFEKEYKNEDCKTWIEKEYSYYKQRNDIISEVLLWNKFDNIKITIKVYSKRYTGDIILNINDKEYLFYHNLTHITLKELKSICKIIKEQGNKKEFGISCLLRNRRLNTEEVKKMKKTKDNTVKILLR